MSRCFPFSPSGYMRNDAYTGDALIESIKLRKEMEKAKKDKREKKDRKEKKREKKEKNDRRKEKKERKRKEKEGTSSHSSDSVKKLKLIEEIKDTRADGKLQKVDDCENEQLERSGITEELDQPVSSREPSCLSDSIESSKRKRGASQSIHDHGSTVRRIRIPLRKHREPEESKPEHQLGSSSGNVDIARSFPQDAGGSGHQLQKRLTNIKTKQFPGNSDSRHGKPLQKLIPGDTGVTIEILEDESRRMETLSNISFQIPPLTYDGFNSGDEDWLFSSKLKEAKPVSKKLKTDSDAFQCSKSLWPPRSQYLPEVEIHALPYVVPF